MLQMVATKHCCWGECKSDSRFPHLLHPALKKRLQEGKPIFLPFPKKSQGLERCLRWVNACGRGKDFTVDKVTKYTYICYLHWPGEAGPTKEFDVPLKATLKSKEVLKATNQSGKRHLREMQFHLKEGNQDRIKTNHIQLSTRLMLMIMSLIALK